MEPSIPMFIVEAFMMGDSTTHTGTGNPAAVCFLEHDDDISDDTKQKIASTMNMSVTAFVSKSWSSSPTKFKSNNDNEIENLAPTMTTPNIIQRTLRWFTPITEIALCTHATIASAKALMVLFGSGSGEKLDKDTSIEFESKLRGLLPATLSGSGTETMTVNFPACETTRIDITTTSLMAWLSEFTRELLGPLFYIYLDKKEPGPGADTDADADDADAEADPAVDVSNFLEDVQYSEKEKILLFRLKCKEGEHPEKTIGKVSPNFQKLMETTGMGLGIADALCTHAIIVTIAGRGVGVGVGERDLVLPNERENHEPDFYSRFFAPYYGTDEDSVTGIAHTILTPYWTQELNARNKVLWARQASARGGDLHCLLSGGNNEDGGALEKRVTLCGRARVVLKGELYV